MTGQTDMFTGVGAAFEVDRSDQRPLAVFSPDFLHRYFLRRELRVDLDAQHRRIVFVMLNPSTADHTNNDPTVTRCINFATGWGYTELVLSLIHI